MATTVIARDFQTAQALYQRSLQGELMEVNRQGQIRTASLGTRVVSALIGTFKGADALDAFRSGQQRLVAQAFRSLLQVQAHGVDGQSAQLRDRSASVDTLDGRNIAVTGTLPAENPYELPTDAQALARLRVAAEPEATVASSDETPDAAPRAALAEPIAAYAESAGKSALNYSTDPALAHLKDTASFIKAEVEHHGTDAGRALQTIGVLKTINNKNQASTGEILQALTPALKTAYESELGRLKADRQQRAAGQHAADAAYRSASLDNPNLPIHELLNRPLFAGAPLAQGHLSDAYMAKVSERHVKGEAHYDNFQPSREILADRNLQRDALRVEFGPDNPASAIAQALASLNVDGQQLSDLQDAFDDLLTPLAADAANRSAYGVTTAQFAAEVQALVTEFMNNI